MGYVVLIVLCLACGWVGYVAGYTEKRRQSLTPCARGYHQWEAAKSDRWGDAAPRRQCRVCSRREVRRERPVSYAPTPDLVWVHEKFDAMIR